MHTPGYEVVTNIPPGAIMLYDSFVDHRAMENHVGKDRYVLYYEFETRGIFTGYVDGHFGKEAGHSEDDFRRGLGINASTVYRFTLGHILGLMINKARDIIL